MEAPKSTYDFVQAKEEYRVFCERENHDIQIFAQPWYLDTVCDSPDDWKVILYKEKNKIVAAFPFQHVKGKYGLWHIRNPWQAPRLGIWIDYQGKTKRSTKEQFENKIVEYIIENLPQYDFFQIAFDARFQNWHQFYWSGFQQTTHYSYTLSKDMDVIESLAPKKRRIIDKMMNEFQVDENITLDEYWNFFEYSYRQRNRKISYSKEKFFSVVQAALKHHSAYLFACKNVNNQIVAVVCVFFDKHRMYSMFGTFDTTAKNSIQVLVELYAINLARKFGLTYDFEGSMIPGVANYNLKFNPVQEPYFVISNYSPKYRMLNSIREFISAVKTMIKGKR